MSNEEIVRMHQKAFRCAYDYLQQHYPPGNTPEWWGEAAKDLSDFGIAAGETHLAVELLLGVFNYLESVWKERRDKDGKADD